MPTALDEYNAYVDKRKELVEKLKKMRAEVRSRANRLRDEAADCETEVERIDDALNALGLDGGSDGNG